MLCGPRQRELEQALDELRQTEGEQRGSMFSRLRDRQDWHTQINGLTDKRQRDRHTDKQRAHSFVL